MSRPARAPAPQAQPAVVSKTDTESWPGLDSGDIHLWWVSLDIDEERRAGLARLLSPPELARAGRLRVPLHRARWLTSRAVVRMLLARYVGEPDPAQLRFRLGPKGKPRLDDDSDGPEPEVHFNYSDTGGMALYGFCRSELGVDLESLDRELRFERIIDRRFTAGEGRALRAVDANERRPAFLRCWTRKEAYGKARGLGIHYPLDSIEVCTDLGPAPCRIAATGEEMDDPRGWTLYPVPGHRGFTATVVVAGSGWSLHQFEWSGDLASLAVTRSP